MSRPRSQVKINFPPWYGNGRNPYRAHREIDQALDNGDSLDASKRVADDCRLRINNYDFSTRPLLVKAVELRRADVIQFLVERGADLKTRSGMSSRSGRRLLACSELRRKSTPSMHSGVGEAASAGCLESNYQSSSPRILGILFMDVDLRVFRPSARTRRRP